MRATLSEAAAVRFGYQTSPSMYGLMLLSKLLRFSI
jgi:hypothetical protein